MPRKYTKRSDYWNKFNSNEKSLEDLAESAASTGPAFAGENFYVAEGSYIRNVRQPQDSDTTRGRCSTNSRKPTCDKYSHIKALSLPYSYKDNHISPRDSILMCQKAYANIPIFRNAIDVMAEFSNSDIYLEGGSEKAQNFIYKWLDKIQCWKMKDQYFREYYRSGNVFIYKLEGSFGKEDILKLNKVYANSSFANSSIPMRYVFLNPYDFVADRAITFDSKNGVYQKLLSEYDIERLKNPKTEYDQQVYDSLPLEAKEKIEKKSFTRDGVKIELDPEKLIYSFYKKQDYEPFATPFGFAVLDDINWKMELKKVDQAISRTVENVILLITMGNTPDKGGVNPHNLQAMQQLFMNESVGRALIADYTTKADFIIPDLNKVLGPEKYEIVNEDIKEGLQNIIVGKENYSSTQIKAQIFLERLKEARNAFISDFLQPQIKEICKSVGLKNFPKAKFIEIDIKDEVQLQRVASRLIEMGIITPEQGMTAIKKGIYPNPEDLGSAQEKLVEDREKGYYVPLAASQPILTEEDQDMKQEKHDAEIENMQSSPEAPSPSGQNKPTSENGRPPGTKTKTNNLIASEQYSRKDIQSTVYEIDGLFKNAESMMRKKIGKKRLNKNQKELISTLIESVVASTEKESWEDALGNCIEDFNHIEKLDVLPEILDISVSHEIVSYPAAILYHSKNVSNNE